LSKTIDKKYIVEYCRQMSLFNYLKDFGLSEKESKVLFSIIKLQSASASEISEDSGLVRTTVYDIVNTLLTSGLIEKEGLASKSRFKLKGPEVFEDLIQRRRSKLNAEAKAGSLLSELIASSAVGVARRFPKVNYFEGKAKIEKMLYEYQPLWRKSGDTKITPLLSNIDAGMITPGLQEILGK
jgi:sugar-specific transcriptional regulator TrmB